MEPGRGSGVPGAGRARVAAAVGEPPRAVGEPNPSVRSNAGPGRCVSSLPRGYEEEEQPHPEADSSNGHGERFPLGLVPPRVTQALGLARGEPASALGVLTVLCSDVKPSQYLFPPTFLLAVSLESSHGN